MIELELTSTVNLQDLAWRIARQIDNSSIELFIQELDSQVADYDFTRNLRDFFVSAIEEEDSAV